MSYCACIWPVFEKKKQSMHFGQSHSLNHLPRKPRKAKFSNYRIRETGCCDNCNICKGNMDTHLLGVVDMYRMQVANKNGGSQRHIGRSKKHPCFLSGSKSSQRIEPLILRCATAAIHHIVAGVQE